MSDTRFDELPDLYPQSVRGRLQGHEAFLGGKLAQTHEGQWLMLQSNNVWTRFTKDAPAVKATIQHWGGRASPYNLNDKTIKDFMVKDALAPIVRGFMNVPTSSAPAIMFRGEVYINSWDTTAVAMPDPQAAAAPELQDILTKTYRMFRENLCGRAGQLSLSEMQAAALSDAEDELEWRFFMSFLAKPLQNLGCNMQVNLWLLGNINGLGRGTLVTQIMPLIYGRANIAELQPAEVEKGGWTDSLVGKLFVFVNELTVTGAFDWNAFIKANSCEGVLKIRHRNRDAYEALNFANWIFTSNAEEPRCLDSKDRRNALIQCFNSMDEAEQVAACDLSLEVFNWIKQNDAALVERYIGGLVYLLMQHTVDDKLLNFAPATILKGDVQDATSVDIKGLYWLQNDDAYPRDEVLPAHHYVEFYNRFAGSKGHVEGRGMGGIMAALSRRGLVKRHKPYQTKAAFWEVSSALFPRATDVDEETKAKAKQKVVSIAGLLPPPIRRRS